MEFFQLSLRDRNAAKKRPSSVPLEELNYKTPMGNTLLHILAEEGNVASFSTF
jgi:hypothetical protein